MRTHGFAIGCAIVMACGETLPVADDPPVGPDGGSDGGDVAVVDATVDAALDADAGCTAPPCNAEEVVTANPSAIAASTSGLAWVEGDAVSLKRPGQPAVVHMDPTVSPGATGFLAMDTTFVVMSQPSGVRRCPINTTCVTNPSAPFYEVKNVGPLAIVDAELWAAEREEARRLVTCGVSGGCGTAPDVVAYLPGDARQLALTSTHVIVGFADHTIRAWPRAGRPDGGAPDAGASDGGTDGGALAPPPLASLGDLRGLAATATEVYWADGTAGTIGRCTVTACAATKDNLLTQRAFPRALAVFGAKLYWVETNANAVLRCTLPACMDATVIANVLEPTALAVGDRVYVASAAEQKVYATAR